MLKFKRVDHRFRVATAFNEAPGILPDGLTSRVSPLDAAAKGTKSSNNITFGLGMAKFKNPI